MWIEFIIKMYIYYHQSLQYVYTICGRIKYIIYVCAYTLFALHINIQQSLIREGYALLKCFSLQFVYTICGRIKYILYVCAYMHICNVHEIT